MIGRDEGKKSAREMTAEIEAATNVSSTDGDVGGGVGGEVVQAGNSTSERPGSRDLGRQAIFTPGVSVPKTEMNVPEMGTGALETGVNATGSSGETMSAEQRYDEERVTEIAEREDGYASEYEPGVSTVGEESKREIKERRAEDDENLRNENDPGRDSEAKIMARSQEERGSLVAQEVGGFLRRKDFAVSELEKLYREQRDKMLLDFENPRTIGGRN